MALYWVATRAKETAVAGAFGVHEKTARNYIKKYLSAIQALKAMKIVWSEGGDEINFLSTDTIHFDINEIRKEPSTKWYSHKSNGPGLSYELGILVFESRLVWIRGPEPAATGDLDMCQAPNGLKSKIPAGKMVIADRSYKDPTCSIRNPLDSPRTKLFKRRARARHENFNARLKNFGVLSGKFRTGYSKGDAHSVLEAHQRVVEAVCVILQYEMENGNPLLDV